MFCTLVGEVVLFIIGLVALVKGSLKLSVTKQVRGVPAWIFGLLLMAPLPLIFCIYFLVGLVPVPYGLATEPTDRATIRLLMLMEVGLIALFLPAALIVGFTNAKPLRRRRYMDEADDGDDYDRPRRRRHGPDNGDEDDDPRPRNRPRRGIEELPGPDRHIRE
jgi:hypothetical protein